MPILGPKYILYRYMDPLGKPVVSAWGFDIGICGLLRESVSSFYT